MDLHDEVGAFIEAASRIGLRMLMVGGGAVNVYGYKRHSADVDFWVEPTTENFDKLVKVLKAIGYELEKLPDAVLEQEQNVSLKLSPEMAIELITRFNPGCSFNEAYEHSMEVELDDGSRLRYRVLSFDDLIQSKLKAARPKDLLDVQELTRIRKTGGDQ